MMSASQFDLDSTDVNYNNLGPYFSKLPENVLAKIFSYIHKFSDTPKIELVSHSFFNLVGREYWQKVKEIKLELDFNPHTGANPLFDFCSINDFRVSYLEVNPLPRFINCLVRRAVCAEKLQLLFGNDSTNRIDVDLRICLAYFLESLISVFHTEENNKFASLTITGAFLAATNFPTLLFDNNEATVLKLSARSNTFSIDMPPGNLLAIKCLSKLTHLELLAILFTEDRLLAVLTGKPLSTLIIRCPDYTDPDYNDKFTFTPLGVSKIFSQVCDTLSILKLRCVPFCLQEFVRFCSQYLPNLKSFNYSPGFLMAKPAPAFYLMVENCPLLTDCYIDQPYNNDYAKFIATYLEYHLNDDLVNNQSVKFELKGSTREFDELIQNIQENIDENFVAISVENSVNRYRSEFASLIRKNCSNKAIRIEDSLVTETDYSLSCLYKAELRNCQLVYKSDSFFI